MSQIFDFPNKPSFREHRKQLQRMRVALHMQNRGYLSPRTLRAYNVGSIAAVLIAATLITLHVDSSIVALTLIALGGLACYWLIQQFSRLPLSQSESLDRMLEKYEPVSKENFRVLQERIRVYGCIHFSSIQEWIDLEEQAIQAAIVPMKDPDARFLNRRI